MTGNQTSVLITLLTLLAIACMAGEAGDGWQESGELAYSYAYARSWLGHRMRREGWRCTVCFTAGRRGEQEHSVWVRGERKMQLMIWRIDSGRTGYCKGELKPQAEDGK